MIIFCPGRIDQFSQLQKLIPSDNFKEGAAVLAGTLLINPEVPRELHRSTTKFSRNLFKCVGLQNIVVKVVQFARLTELTIPYSLKRSKAWAPRVYSFVKASK